MGDGVAFVVYDIANLPVTEYKLDGTVIQYSYDANGNRVQKIVGATASYYVLGADGKAEVLSSGDNQQPIYNIWAGDNIGQIKRNVSRMPRYYYVKDHLGDIRVTVNSTGVVDSYFDYYPFGQLMDGRNSVASADPRYKYTEKERDAETGYDYFGARYYDARIGRFLSADPLEDKYPRWSTYAYSYDNPLAFNDPTGMEGARTTEEQEENKNTDEDKRNHENALQSLCNMFSFFGSSKHSEPIESEDQGPLSSTEQSAVKNVDAALQHAQENGHTSMANITDFTDRSAEALQAAGVASGLMAMGIPATAEITGPLAAGLLSASTVADGATLAGLGVDALAFNGPWEKVREQVTKMSSDVVATKITRAGLGLVIRETNLPTAFRLVSNGQFIKNSVGFAGSAGTDVAGVVLGLVITSVAQQK